jgi:glycosyltransferase involved in cell wall biosynthesis
LRIGVLSCPSIWGGHGVEHWLDKVTSRLHDRHEFFVVTSFYGPKLWSPADHFKSCRIMEINTSLFNTPNISGLVKMKALFDYCDLVYFVYWPASWKFICLFLQEITKTPVIAGHHLSFDLAPNVKYGFSMLGPHGLMIGKRLAAHHALTLEAKSALISLGVGNVYYIPNGVDTKEFSFREKEEPFKLLFIGRLDENKGADLLPKLVQLLNQKMNSDFEFNIAGNGKLNYLVKALEKTYTNVKYLGYISESQKRELYEKCHVLVILSKKETFSLVGLEAMAAYTPVISTNVSGLREYIKSGYNGFLCNNFQEIIEKILHVYRMWKQNDCYEELRFNARKTAERFDWSNVSKKIEAMFLEVVKNAR